MEIRIEPSGLSAERGVAQLCAGGEVSRDLEATLGAPAAVGRCTDGASAVALLVQAATLALDETDLHITLQRS